VTYSQIFQTYAYFTFFWAFLKILENTSFLAPSKNTRISYVTTMTKISGWRADVQKLLLLLLATWDLAGQDPSMDPCGDMGESE
jgi:hypothetical protein